MKKLLSLISALSLTTSTSTAVVSCGIFGGNNNNPGEKTEISKVLTKSYIGKIPNNTSTRIMQTVAELNPSLNLKFVDIKDITETQATIFARESGNYTGSIVVTFEIGEDEKPNPENDLANLIKVTDLGTLNDSQQWTIKTRIVELNSKIDINNILITNIEKNSAIVKDAGGNLYSGKVTVTFKTKDEEIKPEIDLSTIIKNTQLGEIRNNNQSTILTAAKSKNTELKKDSVIATEITQTSAVITGSGNGYYTGSVKVTFTVKDEGTEQIDKVLVGYYYDWGGEAQVKPTFEEIAKTNYNVIDVSFLYSRESYVMPVYEPINAYEVKEGIKLLHSQGKKVIISMGGATGDEMRFRYDQKDQLKQTILNVVDEYGFDGLDIDWEGSCLTDRESQRTTIDALKEIKDERSDFLITMAPEMPYLKNDTEASRGSYIPFLKGLDDYYDWINPQLYNGWAFGPYVDYEDQQRLNLNLSYISNDDVEHRAEFYYLMTKYLTTTYSSQNGFYLIDPDRFVMGASTNEPAGRGAATEEAIKKSYQWLSEDGIYTKGLMTWALNYDAYEGPITSNGQVINWKKWSFESWFNETHGKENK